MGCISSIRRRAALLLLLVVWLAAPRAMAVDPSVPTSARRPANESADPDYQRLRARMIVLTEDSASYRTLTGGVFLGVTALFGGAIISSERLLTGESRRLALGVLGVSAGVSLLGGVLSLVLSTDYEDKPRAFLRTDRWESPAQRMEYGETLLAGLAARARSTRQLLGGFLLALGAGDIAWHFSMGATPNSSFLVYKGALLGTLGAAYLLIQHPAEIEYENARTDRRRRDESPPPPSPRASLQPIDGGAVFSLAFPF